MSAVRLRTGAVVLAAALLLGACGGGDDAEPAATAATPKGFDLPAGVTLSAPETTLRKGQPATVVLEVGDGAASAITSTVKKVTRGDIDDFRFFSLDEASKSSTPFYVTATVENLGPAGLGGVGAPFVGHDDADTVFPPNVINGAFEPCENGTLPEKFLPGSTAEVCMVFLVPKGRTLESIDAQSTDPATAVRWKA